MIKLNSFQKTFYFEWLQDNSKADYNLIIDMDLHGEISPERLNRVITRFVNEHLLYNSNVRYINGDYYWISRSCLNEKENRNPAFTEDLLRCGVRGLSMSAINIPKIKRTLTEILL